MSRTGHGCIFCIICKNGTTAMCDLHWVSQEQWNLCLISKIQQKSIPILGMYLKQELLCTFHVVCNAFSQQLLLGLSVHEYSYHPEKCNIIVFSENGEVCIIHKIVQFPYILGRALVWASLNNEFVQHRKQQVLLPSTKWYILHSKWHVPIIQ